jgi:hypothetical protein
MSLGDLYLSENKWFRVFAGAVNLNGFQETNIFLIFLWLCTQRMI